MSAVFAQANLAELTSFKQVTANIARTSRASFGELAAERAERLSQYRDDLQAFDFFFEMADDSRVWRAGLAELQDLHQRQMDLDPNGALWSQIVASRGLTNVAGPRVGVFA